MGAENGFCSAVYRTYTETKRTVDLKRIALAAEYRTLFKVLHDLQSRYCSFSKKDYCRKPFRLKYTNLAKVYPQRVLPFSKLKRRQLPRINQPSEETAGQSAFSVFLESLNGITKEFFAHCPQFLFLREDIVTFRK